MVLRYMVSDTDLVKGKVGPAQGEVIETDEGISSPKENVSLAKRRVKFWLLFAANVIVWSFLYNHFAPANFWKPETSIAFLLKNIPNYEFPTTNKIKITGIMHYGEKPSAIVCGQVVREGDTIGGYKVVKIHRQKVEFEKDGKYSTKWVSK